MPDILKITDRTSDSLLIVDASDSSGGPRLIFDNQQKHKGAQPVGVYVEPAGFAVARLDSEEVAKLRQGFGERGNTIADLRSMNLNQQLTIRKRDEEIGTAQRELATLRQTNQKHEQTIRDNALTIAARLTSLRSVAFAPRSSARVCAAAQNRAPADEPTAKARATLQEKVSLMFAACPAACSLTEESGRLGFAKHLWGLLEALKMIPRGPYGSNPGDGKTVSIDEPAPPPPPAVARPGTDPADQSARRAEERRARERTDVHAETCLAYPGKDKITANPSSTNQPKTVRGENDIPPRGGREELPRPRAVQPGDRVHVRRETLPRVGREQRVSLDPDTAIDPGALASGCSVTFSGDSAPTGGDGDDEGDADPPGPTVDVAATVSLGDFAGACGRAVAALANFEAEILKRAGR